MTSHQRIGFPVYERNRAFECIAKLDYGLDDIVRSLAIFDAVACLILDILGKSRNADGADLQCFCPQQIGWIDHRDCIARTHCVFDLSHGLGPIFAQIAKMTEQPHAKRRSRLIETNPIHQIRIVRHSHNEICAFPACTLLRRKYAQFVNETLKFDSQQKQKNNRPASRELHSAKYHRAKAFRDQ